MIRTILVPTDGSPEADKAVSLAGQLARQHGAKVVLLHALPDLSQEHVPADYSKLADAEHKDLGDMLTAVGHEILRTAEARLRALGLEDVTTTLPRGPAAQAILDHARQHSADLIVMGSRGLGNIGGLMLGSVSHKVNHLAPCSCLTVR